MLFVYIYIGRAYIFYFYKDIILLFSVQNIKYNIGKKYHLNFNKYYKYYYENSIN